MEFGKDSPAFRARMLRSSILIGIGLLLNAAASRAQTLPQNIDAGLAEILTNLQSASPAAGAASVAAGGLATAYASGAQVSGLNSILVEIVLNGAASYDQVRSLLQSNGAAITGENPAYMNGAFSAYVPAAFLAPLAASPGIDHLSLSVAPVPSVGAVTSQGAKVLHSDVANAGVTGSGITVGVLSDSFDQSPTTFTTIRAANDVATGDLPNLKFLLDAAPSTSLTDEGRAMAQIVYDVAPNSSLCFATANGGQAAFASNIRTLRTNPACAADVIVDDIFYLGEPFFSDGQVAQAVNDVVTSTVLAGKPVAYFSSAGNQRGGGFYAPNAVFTVTNSVPGIDLTTIASVSGCSAAADTGGGFLDFGGGVLAPTINIQGSTTAPARFILQWDDPFDASPSGITTDLNVIFFSSTGTCLLAIATNNFSLNEPIEIPTITTGGGLFTGRIMIARTTPGTHLATRVRIVSLGGYSGIFSTTAPTTFGHNSAAAAIGVAAYVYSSPFTANPFTPAIESFSSPGPVQIAFDAAGNRLPVAETRKKPDIAAPDGVDTTFFFPGQDSDGDGFPNFFGTSAAAPPCRRRCRASAAKRGRPRQPHGPTDQELPADERPRALHPL
jgi:hypothetical protein